MEIRLDGKTALVTGGSKGIGQGIARRLARSGADVAIVYAGDEAGARATLGEIEAAGRRGLALQGDVGCSADVERVFTEVDRAFGGLDILVNNAGVQTILPMHEYTDEQFDRILRTNLYGPFFCCRAAVRRMLMRGTRGRIINITSVHEEACGPNNSAYNASKGGLRNLTRSLAGEVAPHGITVNAVAPGMILTPMNQQALDDAVYLAEAEAVIPARRAGTPDDIAAMVAYLASDLAAYSTGMTHYVDGGWMITQPPV